MSALPRISGRECVKALLGQDLYSFVNTAAVLFSGDRCTFAQLVVPDHKELDRGTLRSIIRQAGVSTDEFNKLLE